MPDLGSLILRNVKGSPLTFTEGDNNIQYAALQSQSVSYTTHYFQSNSLILSRSNGGGIEIKDLGKFTASYAMNAKTASYALSSSNITNYSLYATYSNYVTNSFTILSESVGRGGFFQFTGSFSITSSNGTDPQTASFYLPTTFYSDVRFSGSTTNIDGNLQVVTSESVDGFLGGIKVFRGEEPGIGTNQQFLALNYAFGNGNMVAFEPSIQDAPTMHFVLSSSTIPATSLLTIRKTTSDTVPYAIFGGTYGYNSNTSTFTSYFSGSAVFLAGATGSLRGTASGNFASASISSSTITFFNGYNQAAGTLNLTNNTNQNLQSVTSVGNRTTSSVNIGASNNSSSLSSVAFGSASIAVGSYSFSNGNTVSASGLYSHAEGGSSKASGNYSHAEGISTLASGLSSHAEGYSPTASGDYSHAEGFLTLASGLSSHTEGLYVIASGDYSHAEGESNTASGGGAHAEGYQTTAAANASHTEGSGTKTIYGGGGTGDGAHAEGYQTTTKAQYSHAEGNGTITGISAAHSHAEGYQTVTIGVNSHAEGYQSSTVGPSSHAEGFQTTTKSDYSYTNGYQTIASATAQFVVGHGNIEQTTTYNTVGYRPFIVGGGNITGPRTNLLEVVITKVNGGSLNDGTIVLPRVINMNYSSSAHAASNGIPVGGIYANGTTLMIRK
jgi:hypothetical protein